jgi:hypothetical protein
MARARLAGISVSERKVIADIEEFGWHSMDVMEDIGHPPWTFTIGFQETWRHPELIIVGRSRATAHRILTTFAIGLEENRRPDLAGVTLDLLPGIPCCFVEVSTHHYHNYVDFARACYSRGERSPLYQIVWPSNDGHFPWNPQATKHFKDWQPVLGEVPAGAEPVFEARHT